MEHKQKMDLNLVQESGNFMLFIPGQCNDYYLLIKIINLKFIVMDYFAYKDKDTGLLQVRRVSGSF